VQNPALCYIPDITPIYERSDKDKTMSPSVDTPRVEKLATAHVEEQLGHGAGEEVKNASDHEHAASFMEAFKQYKWYVRI